MKITKTGSLTAEQTEAIKALLSECTGACPLTLSFPFEEGTSFYLLYDPELVCALCLILPQAEDEDGAAECAAFTLPSMQHRGYFSALFKEAAKEIEEIDLLFLIDGTSDGAKKALASLDADFDCSEYRMVLDMKELPASDFNPESSRLLLTGHGCEGSDAFKNILTFRLKPAHIAPPGKMPADCRSHRDSCSLVGSCGFAAYGSSACLYSFEIEAGCRLQGLGREALLLTLQYAKKQGITSVFLHVSGDNEAAVRLYEKTGFRIAETLSYYLY